MYYQEWKDIPTWNGVFQVSNFGRLKRFYKNKYVIILGSKNQKGYYVVNLSYKGRKKQWRLHKLVATVFQRPLVEGEDAHHKNCMKCCNCNFNIQIKDSSKHRSEHKKGKIVSQQQKQKQSKAMKGRKRGHFSAEHKAKIAASRKKYLQQHPQSINKKDPNTGRFINN